MGDKYYTVEYWSENLDGTHKRAGDSRTFSTQQDARSTARVYLACYPDRKQWAEVTVHIIAEIIGEKP